MKRQRLQWLLGTLAALLIVLLGVHLLDLTGDHILEARYNKIERGMTVEQVEALLGPASGSSTSVTDGMTIKWWNFPGQCVLDVRFDASGMVVNKEVSEGNVRTKETTLGDLIKKLLEKIGL